MGNPKQLLFQYKWVVTSVVILGIALIVYLLDDTGEDYYRDEIESTVEVDSVISMLDKLPSGKYESVGYDKVAIFYENHRESYEELLMYINDRVSRDNTEYGIASSFVGRGLVSLKKGEMDSVIFFIQEAEKIMPMSNNRCSYFELIAMYHFTRGDLKMSKNYLNKGLEEAIRHRDQVKRRFFLNKLGSICFNEALYGAASKYFLEVYSTYPSGKGVPAELIGNIISVKMVEGNYQEAETFWKKNEELLASARDKYSRQLIAINRMELSMHLERWDEGADLMKSMPDSLILNNLRIVYLANQLTLVKEKNPDALSRILGRKMEWVSEDYFGAVTRLKPFLLEAIRLDETFVLADSLMSWKDAVAEQFEDNPLALANHHELLSAIFRQKDEMKEAYEALQVSNEYKDRYHLLDDSVKRADFTAKKDFESMKTKQFAFEKELLQQKKINGYLAGTYGSVVLTLLLLVLFLWARQTAKKKELDWAQMQLHVFEHYPQLKAMNLTEKRIFILSVDGYKSKDIAAIVGVTPQYIHNVRSKIRKVLGVDNGVNWESFKDKRGQV